MTVHNMEFFHKCTKSARDKHILDEAPSQDWACDRRAPEEEVTNCTGSSDENGISVELDNEVTQEQTTHAPDKPFNSHELLYISKLWMLP